MKYRQLNREERSALAALRVVGMKPAEIARELGRHRSTVSRELKRNAAPYDGWYRARRAHQRAHARRYRSRRNSRFGRGQWERVEGLLRQEWSPEQVSGHLRLKRELTISHETIYRHIWRDLRSGGTLHQHLRGARKSCRKRYGRYDSRGRLAGKRMIGERPSRVEQRRQIGHWEIDTMMGESPGENSHCVLTLVERKSGYLMLGKLHARTAAEANRALLGLMARHPGRMRTINGGQWDRVPLVWPGGSVESGQVLLRHPASQLGTWDQREHQRTHQCFLQT
jgi:IS30 family transposase